MTLPIERTRAVVELAKEVRALAPYMHEKSETVRIPREVLLSLLAWLRHYPATSELNMTAKLAPHLWAPTGEATMNTETQPYVAGPVGPKANIDVLFGTVEIQKRMVVDGNQRGYESRKIIKDKHGIVTEVGDLQPPPLGFDHEH